MEYRASLFATGYFGYMLVAASVLIPLLLATAGAIVPAVCLISVAFLGLWRLYARKMRFSTTSFLYDGWFTSFTVSRSEIDRVVTSTSLGYPTDRLHGPSEYCVITRDGKKHWVSLLFFGVTASKVFREEIADLRREHGTLVDL